MTISEKLAYIKGLRDGVELDETKPEAKLIDAIIDLLGSVSTAIVDLDDQAEAVSDELDEIEDALDLLESEVYDEWDEDDEDVVSFGGEAEDDDVDADDEDIYDFGDDVLYDVSCPACGESITIDEETLDKGSIACPKCGEVLEFDLSDDEDDSEEA